MDGLDVEQLGHFSAKIVQRAEFYSNTLQRNLELPKDISKSLVVKSQAQYEKEHILYTIKASQYQQELYQNKESLDLETRHKFNEYIHQKEKKNLQKMKQIYKIKAKKAQDYSKHMIEVGRRYTQAQKSRRNTEKQQATKLRKQLMEFYEKEKLRKYKEKHHQVSVGSCYEDAVQRINNIHQKNQQFSQKSAVNLQKELSKNNKFSQRINQRRRSLSQRNKQKEEVYIESLCILQDKEHYFVQKCGQNEDGYLSAWEKIGKSIKEMRKKRGQETKSKLQKWKDCKQRADESKAFIPQRCLSLIDKTSKAAFHKIQSTFRTTARSFQQTVKMNKAAIKQRDQRKKDKIMDLHFDLRLKNNSNAKITERMHSLRHNAGIVASEFL